MLALLTVLCAVHRAGSQTQEVEPRLTGKLGVAVSMRHVGRLEEAESMLRAHLHKHGDDLAYMEELGLTLAQQGKRDEAIQEYKLAIRRFKGSKDLAGIYTNLGLAYEFSKQPNRALQAYTKAIKIDPSLVQARINLGNFYRFVKKDYKQATVQLEAARKLRPSDYTTHFGLAAIYADQGQLTHAAEAFERAIELAPDPTVAKTELAYVLVRLFGILTTNS